jgi:hypothetical protein
MLIDVRAAAEIFRMARTNPERGIVAAVLPTPFLVALSDPFTVIRGGLGIHSKARLFVESSGRMRAAALVFVTKRPEWVVLLLAARPDPGGADGAFRVLSEVCAAAAREGMQRVFAAVPDQPLSRETFFQAGFYSYTTETWFVASGPVTAETTADRAVRPAKGRDAHDLFKLYLRTTPHAVQRAEQLSVHDFDLDRSAGALAPPHLLQGNPLSMRRGAMLVTRDADDELDAAYVAFHGRGLHPHICKLRTEHIDVDLARDLLRIGASSLDARHAVACPVRPYEEHVARALESEGFRAVAGAMLFVKELAMRIEERALAPAVVR